MSARWPRSRYVRLGGALHVTHIDHCQGETIRVLVWVLSFMSFGYATGEFEVTAERLGCYRPEEHIGKPSLPSHDYTR